MSLDAHSGTDQMATALGQASDQLETIHANATSLGEQFENQGWTGMDKLGLAADRIAQARETLTGVAEKIGLGGAIVRDAYLANSMVGEKNTVTDNTSR